MTEDEMMAFNAQPMPSEYARTMRAYINKHPALVKSAKQGRPAWALPTTGNLADDDYRRAANAWHKAHPFKASALAAPTGGFDAEGGVVGPGVSDWANAGWVQSTDGNGDVTWTDPRVEAWSREQEKAFSAQLTPEQRAERTRLYAERDAKNKKRGQLAALAAFAGIGGLGALGAGAFGGAGAGAGGLGAGELGGGLSALDGLGGLGQFGGLDAIAGTGGLGFGELGAAAGGLGGAAGGAATGGGMDLQSILGALGGNGGGGGVNWTNLLGNLGGGLINSYTAGKASDAQVNSAQAANALLKYMYDQSRADQAPYRQAGTSALAGIQRLLKDPSSITAMPDYQFGLDQGTKALNNSASARGMTYSGQQGKALQKWGNDYAGTKLNESYNRLAGIAGIGQQATGQTGALGANYANNASQNITGAGNARGAGYIGQGNAWGNALGGALNGLQDQYWMNKVWGQP